MKAFEVYNIIQTVLLHCDLSSLKRLVLVDEIFRSNIIDEDYMYVICLKKYLMNIHEMGKEHLQILNDAIKRRKNVYETMKYEFKNIYFKLQDDITDEGITNLPLSQLHLWNNNNITDEGIKNLPLTQLHLVFNINITDEGIKNLPLSQLHLGDNNNITDNGITNLSLTQLDLGD